MPRFGRTSQRHLDEAHPDLQRVFNIVIGHFDCSVIEGHRPQDEQNKAFHAGRSKLKWPESRHNQHPSLAVDAVPYPVDWEDRERFYYFAGFVVAVAATLGITVRWGGDWDRDTQVHDQSFFDLPHFELVQTEGDM